MARRAKSANKIAVRFGFGVFALALTTLRPLAPPSVPRRGLAAVNPAAACPPSLEDIRVNLVRDEAQHKLLRLDYVRARDIEHATPSFRVESIVATPEGHVAYAELEPGRTWYSYHGKSTGNPQADPRALANLFGPRAARTFGLLLSRIRTRVMIPLADRINWGLDLLAENGVPTSFRFFDAEGHVTDRQLIEGVARNRAYPMGRAPAYLGHDHGFHGGLIAVPPEVSHHVQNQARLIVQLVEALEAMPLLSASNRIHRDRIVTTILSRYTNMLDTGTGNFSEGLRVALTGDQSGQNFLYENGFAFLTQNGAAPGVLARTLLEEAMSGARLPSDFETRCRRALRTAQNEWDGDLRALTNPLVMDQSTFVRRTLMRARQIREVAERLAPPHHPDSF